MKIENNLLAITNCMFKDKDKWQFVTKKQKEDFFFIINRLLAKRYYRQAQLLNNNYTDKSSALDSWFYFMLDKPYPSWMWEKKSKSDEEEQSYPLVMKEWKIHKDDMYLLQSLYKDKLQEEEKFLNKQK